MATTARWVALPSGRVLDLARPRSDGVLDPEEREYCVKSGIPIGYDPAQLGWVTLLGEDDLADRMASSAPRAEPRDGAPALSLRVARLRERFDVITRPAIEQAKAGLISPIEAEARLWAAVDSALDVLRFADDVITLEKCYTVLRCLAARTIGELHGRRVDAPAPAPAPAPEPRPVEASRFTFRPWQLNDADVATYRRLLDNPKLWEFVPEEYPSPFTDDTARVLIQASQVASHHEVLAAELDGVPVGQVRLLFDDSYPGLNAAEVSYWIGEPYWGRSLGTKILRLITQRGLRERPLDLIYAWIRTEHAASIKTAERAGYRPDPFPRLSAFAREARHAGCGRWIRFRSDEISASAAISASTPPRSLLRRAAP